MLCFKNILERALTLVHDVIVVWVYKIKIELLCVGREQIS